jgi:hypothetical protein
VKTDGGVGAGRKKRDFTAENAEDAEEEGRVELV